MKWKILIFTNILQNIQYLSTPQFLELPVARGFDEVKLTVFCRQSRENQCKTQFLIRPGDARNGRSHSDILHTAQSQFVTMLIPQGLYISLQ